MAARTTSAAVRFWDALVVIAATSATLMLLLPASSQAAPQGARTSALTPLEEALIITEEQEPAVERQPVLGYLRLTEDGWQMDMLPGAVSRTGPLPVLTQAADARLEDLSSHTAAPSAPLLRVDF